MQAKVDAFLRDELPSRRSAWESSAAAKPVRWKPLEIVEAASAGGASMTVQPDGSIRAEGAAPETDTYTIIAETDLGGITALRLEALPDPDLPAKGPGRAGHGNFVLSELTATAAERFDPDNTTEVGLRNPSADFSQKDWAVAGAIDGDPKTGWAVSPEFGQRHAAVFETDLDIGTECGTRFVLGLDQRYGGQHTLGRFRLSATDAPRPVAAGDLPDAVAEALATPPDERTEAQEQRLDEHYRALDPELAKLEQAVDDHAKKVPKAPDSKVRTFAEPARARESHILLRGDFLRPGDAVEPGVPGVLNAFRPAGDRPNRLDLARWLLDPSNPLTARVAVNRVWQHLFGRAIVTSVEDFGTRGELPSHPELLDWLATEYPRLGWSRKELIKTIVMSSTYRQSSAVRPELAEVDPENALFARQNRFRLEAEAVRDAALAASGLLSSAIGGPSVYPPQPEGISDLTYAGSARWKVSGRGRPLPTGDVYLLPQDIPLPDAPDLRRPRRQRLRRRARAVEHPAPGPHAAQRRGLRRVRPGPRRPADRRVRLRLPRDADRAGLQAGAGPRALRGGSLDPDPALRVRPPSGPRRARGGGPPGRPPRPRSGRTRRGRRLGRRGAGGPEPGRIRDAGVSPNMGRSPMNESPTRPAEGTYTGPMTEEEVELLRGIQAPARSLHHERPHLPDGGLPPRRRCPGSARRPDRPSGRVHSRRGTGRDGQRSGHPARIGGDPSGGMRPEAMRRAGGDGMSVARGDVYFVDLDPVRGREQAGRRPAVVLSVNAINQLPLVVTVVIGTSGANVRRDYPSNARITPEESGLPRESVFLGFQIRSIDADRFDGRPSVASPGRLSNEWRRPFAIRWGFDPRPPSRPIHLINNAGSLPCTPSMSMPASPAATS